MPEWPPADFDYNAQLKDRSFEAVTDSSKLKEAPTDGY